MTSLLLIKMDWQPIETVPMNAEPVLVWLSGEHLNSRYHVATYHPNLIVIGGSFSFDVPTPTHWCWLPEPPKVNKIETT